MEEKLIQLRNEIDNINLEIINLLARRSVVVKKVGEYKKEKGIEITDTKREDFIFEKLDKLSEENKLSKEFVRNLFKLIIKDSKRLQN